LAVIKVLAASSRAKARDFADLLAIQNGCAPLGAIIVMAAAGKPPSLSPVKTIEKIRRRLKGIGNEGLLSVAGRPSTAHLPTFGKTSPTR
jgi:hypothetical protein